MSASPAESAQAATEATPQAGTPTSATSQVDETETLSPAELRAALTAANKEAASHRTKLRAFERQEEERRQATLSEVEKRDARIRQLEEGLTAAQAKERDYALRDGIAEIVTRDDFPASPAITAKSLIRLLDRDKIQWADDGTPRNLPALLVELVRAEPSAFRAKDRRPGPGDAGHFGTIPNGADMNAQIRQKAGRG
jgi:phage-related minor tail protein